MKLNLSRASLKRENHHLFLQTPGRTVWWIGLTLHGKDGTVTRIRRSLQTHDVQVARKRRDLIIGDLLNSTSGHGDSVE